MTTTIDFRENDVVRYDTLSRPDRWCREGFAIARRRGDGRIVLLDTFWALGSESHVLTGDEVATAQVEFNLDDFIAERDIPGRWPWQAFHPDDRRMYTSQHGLRVHRFVRKGAEPDGQTQIDNARRRVSEAEEKVASAQRSLEYARWMLEQETARHG
ncbi:hypothetical protein [Isoptericola croceus]|uniref:hypothetical protein n=1 Tax=Isoptericola croceus TaxID=3031406 RepID=UPI0023F9CBD0|nr:hypothetical protein [Isoptericola croceus]